MNMIDEEQSSISDIHIDPVLSHLIKLQEAVNNLFKQMEAIGLHVRLLTATSKEYGKLEPSTSTGADQMHHVHPDLTDEVTVGQIACVIPGDADWVDVM